MSPLSLGEMESPAEFPESVMDGDDIAYPCKGCGEVSCLKSLSISLTMLTARYHRSWKRAKPLNSVSDRRPTMIVALLMEEEC